MTIEGGLHEPEQFEPEPGTLALLLPGDDHRREDWDRAAAGVLRKARRMTDDDADAEAWDRLSRRTLDGIEVPPLGTPALLRGLDTARRPTRSGAWDVRVRLGGRDAETLNGEALADLEGGASSLWLRPGDADLAGVLDGVLLDLAPVVLDAPDDPFAAADAFLAVLGDTHPAPGTNLGVPGTASDDVLLAVAEKARAADVLAVVVDATYLHEQGASDAQELAWSMVTGARVLRVLEAAGISVSEGAALVEFRYAATDEQFPTIGKLRAARRLWNRVLALSDAAPVTQRQHVVTSRPMMSRYDPWVNMLRTTVAAFAAGVGGADAVTVLPFDSPLGRPDGFGRRIARNTSAVLVEEAHLGRVTDPAGGSFAVEKLTHDFCLAAWDLVGEVEDGATWDDLIAPVVAGRDRAVVTRERPLTGVTEFPHLGEALPVREPDPTWGDVRRYGAAFEALRDDPATSPVFLATLGSVAAHTARAGFVTNLLAAGGISVEVAGPTAGVDDLLAAYAGQPVVCLAGTDQAYSESGAETIAALRGSGARHVVVAGAPRGSTSEVFAAVDDSCAVGVDTLAFLQRTRDALR